MQTIATTPIHVVIMGVSGSGKTTVAGILADRLGWDLAEADEFHPQANIDKMHAGIPLTDDDRWPWLERIREWMSEKERQHASTIVTCSALKHSYRDALRHGAAPVIFIHLDGDRTLLEHRLSMRTDHFMPPSLLESQYNTLEPLGADEAGAIIDIAGTPSDIASEVEISIHSLITQFAGQDASHSVSSGKATVGVYGLGVMGSALARNIARHGFTTSVTNIDAHTTERFMASYSKEGNFIPSNSAADFVATLAQPRIVLVMVTAGPAVDSVIAHLSSYLESGDVIVDMGNSNFQDTIRREAELRARGIYFLGCGTSGGEQGALEGPALMIGGSAQVYHSVQPIFEAIAAKAADGSSCAVFVGSDGAGHFTKMLHNGIEYADMQLICEVYDVLHHGLQLPNKDISRIFAQWNEGDLSSYLMEISSAILTYQENGTDFIEVISDHAAHKGTGAWSSINAIELGVDASMLVSALFARFASVSPARGATTLPASQVELSTHTKETSSLSDLSLNDLHDALFLAKLVAYSQGFEVIQAASHSHGWDVDLAAICRGWRAGCIIRSAVLDDFAAKLTNDSSTGALLHAYSELIERYLPALRNVVASSTLAGIPTTALSSALNYLNTLQANRLPTALVQAQRDYFGAHGFERVDKDGTFHGPWHAE